jgi:cryptochrome
MGSPPQAEPTINQNFIKNAYTPIAEDHDEKYGVPTLEELG